MRGKILLFRLGNGTVFTLEDFSTRNLDAQILSNQPSHVFVRMPEQAMGLHQTHLCPRLCRGNCSNIGRGRLVRRNLRTQQHATITSFDHNIKEDFDAVLRHNKGLLIGAALNAPTELHGLRQTEKIESKVGSQANILQLYVCEYFAILVFERNRQLTNSIVTNNRSATDTDTTRRVLVRDNIAHPISHGENVTGRASVGDHQIFATEQQLSRVGLSTEHNVHVGNKAITINLFVVARHVRDDIIFGINERNLVIFFIPKGKFIVDFFLLVTSKVLRRVISCN